MMLHSGLPIWKKLNRQTESFGVKHFVWWMRILILGPWNQPWLRSLLFEISWTYIWCKDPRLRGKDTYFPSRGAKENTKVKERAKEKEKGKQTCLWKETIHRNYHGLQIGQTRMQKVNICVIDFIFFSRAFPPTVVSVMIAQFWWMESLAGRHMRRRTIKTDIFRKETIRVQRRSGFRMNLWPLQIPLIMSSFCKQQQNVWIFRMLSRIPIN